MLYKCKNRLLKNNIILICFLSAFKRAPMLFYYLCDLIVYEQFFRNDLLTDCLSDSELLQLCECFLRGHFFPTE